MTAKRTVPIESVIIVARGHRVLLAADLARIYGVETRVLNQAVKRNGEKFPEDFMFRLTRDEAESLVRSRSQSVILKRGQNIKFLPYVFTEHGAIMAANVLNSPHAVQMSVFVIRAFVRLRHVVTTHKALAGKLAELEQIVASHDGISRPYSMPSVSSWSRRLRNPVASDSRPEWQEGTRHHFSPPLSKRWSSTLSTQHPGPSTLS
jgi:hypothetical protein